jgi:hypothetical protein
MELTQNNLQALITQLVVAIEEKMMFSMKLYFFFNYLQFININ